MILNIQTRYRAVLDAVLKTSGDDLIEGLKAFIEASMLNIFEILKKFH